MVDLTDAPVVDAHCHPWRNDELVERDPLGFEDRVTMMGMCLISSGLAEEGSAEHLALLTESTPFALTMRRRLAEHLGAEATREAVARLAMMPWRRTRSPTTDGCGTRRAWRRSCTTRGIRSRRSPARTSRRKVRPVSTVWLVSSRSFSRSVGAPARSTTSRTRSSPSSRGPRPTPELVAFKSVIAYRTGLDVEDPPADYCERSFKLWREDDFVETRQHAKPVRDRLLRRTLEVAKAHDRPVHVHCGGGDPAIVLAHARPQDLFPLLSQHDDQPVVLIHSGWPWLEEGAYVASVLPHVYLEMSITMPWGTLAIDQKLEVLLGAAPPAKILYGSDESTEPEVIWLSAQLGREALGPRARHGGRAHLAQRGGGPQDR